MKINPLILLFSFIILSGCISGDKETPTDAEIVEDSITQASPDIEFDSLSVIEPSKIPGARVQFICRDIGQGMDNPLYEVSLLVGQAYYTLDTIHTCDKIQYGDYDEFEIPNRALTAAGGWWKDEGDYFFAFEEYGEIVVMHAWQTEEQSTQGYFYKVERRIQLPKLEPLEEL